MGWNIPRIVYTPLTVVSRNSKLNLEKDVLRTSNCERFFQKNSSKFQTP